MPNDAVFRWCLVSLGATVVAVGLYTQSLKKMAATYLVGMLAIAGVFLPDWDFFDRDVSHWCSPISLHHSAAAAQPQSTPSSLRLCFLQVVDVHIKLAELLHLGNP
ncbi:signal peptidase complex-like protein DTM1 isoform X2 [Diospyros lotus]|uniref:signal peptidase complex-like protein DTM1 isoform X2 n=1 Tax=Diospyros lotus TaxID=55363 RepID=UPI0022582A63|nr:signal peptidase complex-like protein DTM1 isoform X2 [Diospyros lotus]